jgi:subtilisin family serine protease
MNRTYSGSDSIFRNGDYYQYIVQYQGDIVSEITPESGYYVYVLDDKYAILVVPAQEIEIDIKKPIFKSIVYVKPVEMYTLQEISPIEAANISFIQTNTPLNLTGKGVCIAIVDSGIDYLSEEFMTADGQTRIDHLWDQTVPNDKERRVPYGTEYTKEQIQEAINANRQGKSPYDIVPSIDNIGHGTNMTGIVGATGKNEQLRGVAYDSSFVVIKLSEDYGIKKRFHFKAPAYNITAIFAALNFLYEYSLNINQPLVIYLPLGSNFGNHKGNHILEEYIEFISSEGGLVVVCGTGNQAANGTHTSGVITEAGQSSIIELQISPEQLELWVEIWTELPNIMSLDIISPSGENTGIIPSIINSTELYNFVFEKTLVRVNYYLPEESSGDELIRIRFYNLIAGTWRIRLTANAILSGRYDAWLPTEGITLEGTRFNMSDYYGTVTNPATSQYTVAAAAYNQNNNNILDYSGRALRSNYVDVVDIAAGGVNTLTVAPNNKTEIVNGTSVSAAVLAGVCALLFEWGVVNGNEPNMYVQTIKAYIERGTDTRKGDIYPNPQWGYGILNVLKIFENIT